MWGAASPGYTPSPWKPQPSEDRLITIAGEPVRQAQGFFPRQPGADGARALLGGQNWCDTPTSPLERKWGVISPWRRQCACRGHGLCERQSGVVTPARGGPSPECHPLDTAGGTRADPPGAPVSTSGLRRGLCATCRWGLTSASGQDAGWQVVSPQQLSRRPRRGGGWGPQGHPTDAQQDAGRVLVRPRGGSSPLLVRGWGVGWGAGSGAGA